MARREGCFVRLKKCFPGIGPMFEIYKKRNKREIKICSSKCGQEYDSKIQEMALPYIQPCAGPCKEQYSSSQSHITDLSPQHIYPLCSYGSFGLFFAPSNTLMLSINYSTFILSLITLEFSL